MPNYAPRFEDLQDKELSVLVMTTSDVSLKLWKRLHGLQSVTVHNQVAEALRDNNDGEYIAREMARASSLTDGENVELYRRRRQKRNEFVGVGGTGADQTYRKPRVAVVFEGVHSAREPAVRLLGGVGLVGNASSSPSMPRPLRRLEREAKLLIPPRFPGGGHGVTQITDLWIPGEQTAVPLLALNNALTQSKRSSVEPVSAYHTAGDAADGEMGWLVDAVGLRRTGGRDLTGSFGDPTTRRQDRYEGSVGSVLEHIGGLPGAQEVIANTAILSALPDYWE